MTFDADHTDLTRAMFVAHEGDNNRLIIFRGSWLLARRNSYRPGRCVRRAYVSAGGVGNSLAISSTDPKGYGRIVSVVWKE